MPHFRHGSCHDGETVYEQATDAFNFRLIAKCQNHNKRFIYIMIDDTRTR